jgi:hypothetical protein
MTQALLDVQLRRLHRHRRLQRVLDGWLPYLAVGLGAAAVAVMVLRLAWPGAGWLALPLAAIGALLPSLAIPRAWARRDDVASLAGHLDRACGVHGVAMALAAQAPTERDGDWVARLRRPLEDLRLPALRPTGGVAVSLAATCLLVALALPQRESPAQVPTVVATLFRHAGERLAGLEQAGLVPPAEQQQVRQDLEQLEVRASDQGMDQPTWEALDRIRQRLDRSVATSTQRLAQALAQGESLARPNATPRSDDTVRLAQAVAELALQAPGLVPKLPSGAGAEELAGALAQAVRAGLLSPEQAEAVQRLGLVRPDQGRGLDADDAKALGQHLAQELAKARAKLDALGEGRGFDEELERARQRGQRGGRGGRGDADEGSGHAPLTWGDPTRTPGGGIEGLPAGAQLNPDGSVTIAEQVRDAEIDDAVQRAALRAAARAFDPTAADARRATVAPRHRAVVERYFAGE